jgi:hypothetical protein
MNDESPHPPNKTISEKILNYGFNYLTNLCGKLYIYKGSIISQPTSVDEIINLVKYAKNKKMKITVVSGGHSNIIMRAFPSINKHKLLVIDMQKYKGIKLKNKKLIINSGAIVKDIKNFNKTLSNYYCLHGDCNKVGMGFWLNGMSGISGIPYTFFQVGSGSDHIKKINYVDSNGEYKSVVDNNNEFNALKMIAGEFGIVTSIEVSLEKGKPVITYFMINVDIDKIIILLRQIEKMDYEGNISIIRISNDRYIISHTATIELDDMYSYRLMTEHLGLQVSQVSYSILNLFISKKIDVGMGYNYIDDSEADFIIDLDDNLHKIIKRHEIVYIMISNPKYKSKFNNKIMIGLWYNKNNYKKIKNDINKYYPNNIKYLNCPLYSEPIKNYITEFSPLSYSKLLEMKKIMDATNLFVTRYNAFDTLL